jgi:hypothetical protein
MAATACDGFYRLRGRAVSESGEPLAGAQVTVRMSSKPCDDGWPVSALVTDPDGIYDTVLVGPSPLGDWDFDSVWSVEFRRAGYEDACVVVAHVHHRCSPRAVAPFPCWTVDGVLRPAGSTLPAAPSVPPPPE